jgi:hypothetical protein
VPKPVLQLRSIVTGLLVLPLLAALAACQDEQADTGVPAGVPALSPSPEPSGNRWGRMADAAFLTDTDLAFLPGPVVRTMDTGGSAPLSPCGRTRAEEDWAWAGSLMEWQGSDGQPVVNQFVRPFSRRGLVVSAADVVGEIRARTTCRTYVSREGEPRLTGELTLPPLTGVDAQYVLCEEIKGDGKIGACTVFLGRGAVVSKVRVRAPSEAMARERATTIAKAAAERLAAG